METGNSFDPELQKFMDELRRRVAEEHSKRKGWKGRIKYIARWIKIRLVALISLAL